TVARQQNEAFARQAPALSRLLDDPNDLMGPASFQSAFDRVGEINDPKIRSVMHNSLSNLAMTYELTAEAPCGKEDVERHLELLEAQRSVISEQLEALRSLDVDKLDLGGRLLHACLAKDLETQLDTIQTQHEYLSGLKDGDPLSGKALHHAKDLWIESAN